ncbi:peptidoglycan-recognition protein LB-like [Epargyreus clarus]|uniref:peptidoglycan-recognition protein LB-like n=1 Tax=Epargyreus clarus TaxID=520877 RepID=UPI003C2F883E
MALSTKQAGVTLVVLCCLTPSVMNLPHPRNYEYDTFVFYNREQWGGREATGVTEMVTPVPYVVIHHSYEPGACFSFEECTAAMRSMQNFHQIHQGWTDIGYNFAVGSDGAVYEGRGWDRVGAHAVGYNVRSIGIVLIGDWVSEVPRLKQLVTVKNLINEGVRLGYISPEYDLIGHRQVSATECPGQALFEEITTWDRFQPTV